MTETELLEQIRNMLVDTLMLPTPAGEIGFDTPLFGPGGLGLDSVDALQLVVALDKHYGIKITDPAAAKEVLQSITTMGKAVLDSGTK
jgi:acyl carrier protein